MNSKKGLRYYVIVFFFSVIALIAYIAYLSIKEGSISYETISSYIYVPPVFTVLLFVFDKVFDKFFPSKVKQEDPKYNKYLKDMNNVLSDKCDFSIEEYRRLRTNTSFQKSIDHTYKILNNGESEDVSFLFLEKKFKKNTNEYIALQAVVEEVKKMMKNS